MAVNFLDGIIVGGELTATGSTNNITTTNGSSSLYLLNLTRTTTSLTTAGSVGIGTTSPATKLHVSNGDIRIDNSKQLQFGSGGVRINNDASGRMYQKAPLDFYWETQGYTMVLKQSGDLGIGTTSPTKKLDVNGTARFRSDTQVDKAFIADSYYSSFNAPGGIQIGIHANVLISTKANLITLTFRSGLLVGYKCEGEECPEQPE